MYRISITGLTGSGKTTLAAQIAKKCNIPHVEIDAIQWGPNWTQTPRDLFRERVAAALSGNTWVICGNYTSARPIIWTRADTLIWLDYPLPFVMSRLFKRTLKRVITRETLWGGNRESFREQFLSRDSIFLWALKQHRRHHREIPHDLALPQYQHLKLYHFHRASETTRWLKDLNCDPTWHRLPN